MKTVNNCNARNENDFFCNFDKNYCDILKQKNESSSKNEHYQSDMNMNSYIQGLSISDDEALEDYLSALAKNYDDIDRRIKNAERFVDQIDNNQNTDCTLKNGFKKGIINENSLQRHEEKEIKYVTELRVNIADNLKSNTCSNFRKTYIKKNNEASLNCQSLMEKTLPYVRKRTSITSEENLNSIKSPNQNFSSPNLNTDFDPSVIPPPKLFSSKYFRNEIMFYDKEVQTMDFNKYAQNIFAQSILEDRAIQTISPINYSTKKTIDTGMETEKTTFREVFKEKYVKEENKLKSWSSHSPELIDSEKSIGSNNSYKSEYSGDNTKGEKHLKVKTGLSRRHNSVDLPTKRNVNRNISRKTTNAIIDKPQSRNAINKNMDKKKILKSCHNIGNMESENIIHNRSKENHHVIQNTKDCTKNASLEIQRLLENLDSHLQARMNTREINKYGTKPRPLTESTIVSFWDNPLQRNDLINSKNKSSNINDVKPKPTSIKKPKKNNNIINSELQAICKTIEKNIKNESHSTIVQNSSESENEFSDYIKNKIDPLRSESLNTRQTIMNSTPIHNIGIMKRSTSNLNLAVETRFPSKYKMSRSFDLNPYDDIIKAHLNPIDRRVKSVAAKNNCTIIIDGPLKCYDPSNTQALRNKVMYRCTIAGACKDSLDKCFNYLKETFPNTFLKTNARIG